MNEVLRLNDVPTSKTLGLSQKQNEVKCPLTNERMVSRGKRSPGFVRPRERKFPGTNGPGNECSRELIVLRTNVPAFQNLTDYILQAKYIYKDKSGENHIYST